jgi:hypothetical protein
MGTRRFQRVPSIWEGSLAAAFYCALLLERQEERHEMTVHQDEECNREVLICRSGNELPDQNWGWVAITRGDVEQCQEGIIHPANQERVMGRVVEQAGECGMTVCHI